MPEKLQFEDDDEFMSLMSDDASMQTKRTYYYMYNRLKKLFNVTKLEDILTNNEYFPIFDKMAKNIKIN